MVTQSFTNIHKEMASNINIF